MKKTGRVRGKQEDTVGYKIEDSIKDKLKSGKFFRLERTGVENRKQNP